SLHCRANRSPSDVAGLDHGVVDKQDRFAPLVGPHKTLLQFAWRQVNKEGLLLVGTLEGDENVVEASATFLGGHASFQEQFLRQVLILLV
ncbi:hypothetical protein D4G79_24310, partial [Salmonella enterica subsp. enterica]